MSGRWLHAEQAWVSRSSASQCQGQAGILGAQLSRSRLQVPHALRSHQLRVSGKKAVACFIVASSALTRADSRAMSMKVSEEGTASARTVRYGALSRPAWVESPLSCRRRSWAAARISA